MNKRCYNCKFHGYYFKVGGETVHHCKEPKTVKENKSGWDTLRGVLSNCKLWESEIKAVKED
jgi:hypothetical protein